MAIGSLRRRVRQHVNPLSQKHQSPIKPPDWSLVYASTQHPLHLDIGSARGHFLLGMAQQQPDWNFLGLEIRKPLVELAEYDRQQLGLTNLHFICCNANNSVRSLLGSLQPGSLQQVTIQFPDPWFKKRHQKRRVVQPELIAEIADYLIPSGQILLQSDIEAVAQEMVKRVSAHPAFVRQGEDWLPENPLPVQTEREAVTLAQGNPVYRALFVRQ